MFSGFVNAGFAAKQLIKKAHVNYLPSNYSQIRGRDSSAASGTVYQKDTILCRKMQSITCIKSAKIFGSGHIRAISCSISSIRVAQLVAMRMTVWLSSYFSQKPNLALPSSAFSWLFARMGNT